MHIAAAFILGVCLLAGFQPLKDKPKGEMILVLNSGEEVTIRPTVKPLTEIQNENIVQQQFDYSCGSAALGTLLNAYLGESFTENQVIQGLMNYGDVEKIKKRRAFSLLDMKRFVNVLGYEGMGYKAGMGDLKGLDVPVILPIKIFNYRHFAVLRGFYGGHVFLADPWRGNISFPESTFADMWYKNVLFMVEPAGRPTLNLLALGKEDLRFIDEDTARRTLFDESMDLSLPAKRRVDGMHVDYQYYKP